MRGVESVVVSLDQARSRLTRLRDMKRIPSNLTNTFIAEILDLKTRIITQLGAVERGTSRKVSSN